MRFRGALALSNLGEFGAGMDEDDMATIDLNTAGEAYTIRYPYTARIEPNGSRKVGLTLYCCKSSNHSLVIRANNANGLDISSKPVRLHILNTPHSIPQYSNVEVEEYYEEE